MDLVISFGSDHDHKQKGALQADFFHKKAYNVFSKPQLDGGKMK